MESTTLSSHRAERPLSARLTPGDRIAIVAETLRAPGAAGWLLGLLLAAVAYAAFASGAIELHEESRLQVAVAALVLFAGAALALRALHLPRGEVALAWTGVGLLGAFAAWSALSIEWSILPAEAWLSANRALVYFAVVGLALIAGAALPRSQRVTALAITVLAGLVAAYALGGKLLPGVHFLGFDLNQTGSFSRLRAPIEYWNALGLFCVFGTPLCLSLAGERDRPEGLRVTSVLLVCLLVTCAAFTYSRGAFIALAVVALVMIGGGPDRIGRLAALGMALLAAVPPLLFGLTRPDLTTDNLAVGARVDDGLMLALILTASLYALQLGWRRFIRAEADGRFTPEFERRTWRYLRRLAAALIILWVLGAAASSRGLTGTISGDWHGFTRAKAARVTDPGRLFTANASNRWVWWSEALGAFSAKPVAGWGAGSFPATHLLYRHNRLEVRQPHDVPLQFLAETGLIGALLALGGLAALGCAVVARIRASSGAERAARLSLAAIAAAWAVHGLYDWDWDIPAVTLPALIAAAVAAAPRPPGRRVVSARASGPSRAPEIAIAAVAAVAAIALAVSGLRPALADDRRISALGAADQSASKAGLEGAAARAALAAKLDPTSVDPIFAQATIAVRRGRLQEAYALLAKAVRRQPDNVRTWRRLLDFQLGVGETRLLGTALRKLARLDPLGRDATTIAGLALLTTSPYRSPTATGTPLPPLPRPVKRQPQAQTPTSTPTPSPTAPVPAAPAKPAPAKPAPKPKPSGDEQPTLPPG